MNRSYTLALVAAVVAIFAAVIAGWMTMDGQVAKAPELGSPPQAPRDRVLPTGAPRVDERADREAPSDRSDEPRDREPEAGEPATADDDEPGDTSEAEFEAQQHELEGEAVPDRSIWPVSADGIKGAVAESLPGILDCYDGWLEQNPDLSGRIEVAFTITPTDGGHGVAEITNADIDDSTMGHVFMEGCVLSVMEELQFEASEPTTVSYPFIFKVKDDVSNP